MSELARHRQRRDSMKAKSIQARDRRCRVFCALQSHDLIATYNIFGTYAGPN